MRYLYFILLFFGFQCHHPETTIETRQVSMLADEEIFNDVLHRSFRYFWDIAEENSGLSRERYHEDDPSLDAHVVSSGASGFGLMAIIIGIERAFITRKEGVERLQKMIDFLQNSDRFHGVWPHWLDGRTGKVIPFSPKDNGADLVETAYLAQGLLCVRQYLNTQEPMESKLYSQIDDLWRSIEWDFFRGENHENVLFWHWSPDYNWEMNFRIRGYNETLITYILAASSQEHGIDPEVYHEGWAESGKIKNMSSTRKLDLHHQGIDSLGGPLFWAHYSFLGLDPRQLKDTYADYWTHNVDHVLINREHCIKNPHNYRGYGPDSWGLTASYSINFYAAHSPSNDLGVISPTASLASFPYTPEYSMQALRYFYQELGVKLLGDYGLYDAFSEQFDWFPKRYLAIDQGPIVIMMDNYQNALCWNLFISCPELQFGLQMLGCEF